MSQAAWVDLGRMAYRPCTELQAQLLGEVAAGTRPDTLLLVEHDPVLTLGAGFHESNLLLSREEYARRGIAIESTDRGGDVTYHGPGQLVAYPIFDLRRHGKDVHKWLRDLEQVLIDLCARFDLEARRFPPHTGVWIGDKKVAAIGIKVRKWVSMHGIALNCNNELSSFDLVVPCGIQGYSVTSLSQELGREVTVAEVKPILVGAFLATFGTRAEL